MKFRKKPVVIEAWKTRDLIKSAKNQWDTLPSCIVRAYENGDIIFMPDHLLINTLEGQHRANVDDWIIQGVKGEFYPCKPDIFEATYDSEK